ncbi:MAG: N,N-dimethylformamidase beta subunit family domain-containing protein [Thermoleophilaceae bacterium]
MLLTRVVFGLLVIATAGAFVITQRIKSSAPIVERVFFFQHIGPECECPKGTVAMRFDLPEADRVTIEIVDERGDVVREIAEGVRRGVDTGDVRWEGRTANFRWNGRTGDGEVPPDGVYRLRVTLREEGRAVTAPRELNLDTRPPSPQIVEVSPPTVIPTLPADNPRGRVRIRLREGQDPAPVFRVYRTDDGEPRLAREFEGPRFRRTAEWDGRDGAGEPVADGVYVVSVTTEDKAGNRGRYPVRLTPEAAGERTGVSARYLTISAPLEPVRAGSVARVTVGPIERRSRWNLTRLGSSRPVERGRADGRTFGIRVPSDASTGVYLLRVQAGGHRVIAPIAVSGRGRGDVLMVLPTITWEGRNRVDDDRDGFPDTLERSDSVRIGRGFAHGDLPTGFESRVSPLLRFLDREDLRYDLTTDLALARGEGPGLDGRPGVVFAGDERWLTGDLDLRLREYVEDGGRVASFGVDSFRRRVDLTPDLLRDPSLPELRNVFGEDTALVPTPAGATPITPTAGPELFEGADANIGLFTRLELSRSLAPGLDLVAAAGLDEARPALMAYRLGRGTVVRAGSPQWAAQLDSSDDVATITRNIWELLEG